MLTTFANTIDGNDIYAKRAECDAAGNTLSTTYATKQEIPTVPTIVGLVAGSNVTITESNNAVTIAATDTTYTAGTGIDITNGSISNSDPLPSHTSTEASKVLGVDSNGDLEWVAQSGGSSYSAGTGIDITSGTISVDTSTVAMKTDIPSVPVTDVTVDGTSVVSNGTAVITMPTIPTTDQIYNSSSTNPQSGTAVAGAISGVAQVPAVTSSDDGKVLKASYTGGTGSFSWETESGGGGTQVQSDWTESDNTEPSYIQNKPTVMGLAAGSNVTITEGPSSITIAATVPSAGNMLSTTNNVLNVTTTAGITDIQQVAALPASPVATVLYLIPET